MGHCSVDDTLLVQHDQAVHLARDADALDLGLAALGQSGEDLHSGLVPVGGILLAPVGIRRGDGVADAVLREDGAVAVQKDTLAGGGTQINTDIVIHGFFPFSEIPTPPR